VCTVICRKTYTEILYLIITIYNELRDRNKYKLRFQLGYDPKGFIQF